MVQNNDLQSFDIIDDFRQPIIKIMFIVIEYVFMGLWKLLFIVF